MQTYATIKEKNLVEKRNALNEMYFTDMTMQEMRLFSVYLSIIDRNDVSTKQVRFSLEEFKKIIGTKHKNIDYYKQVVGHLAAKSVATDVIDGNYKICPLFINLEVSIDEYGEWSILLDSNGAAMPFLFGYKNNFFQYKLWNVMHLKGKNHIRMYEILKQYEKVGWRTIQIDNLRGMLGIEEGKYPEFNDFKRRVLAPCQEALAKNTDICFEYEIHSKKGRKIDKLKFIIIKNEFYRDPLRLEELIDLNAVTKEIAEAEAMDQDSVQLDTPAAAEQELKSYSNQGYVCMTKTEYEILVSEHGKAAIDACIADMEDYILSKGKFYENYPAAIRRWLRNDFNKKFVREDKEEPSKKRNRFANFKGRERDYDEIEHMEREYLVKSLEKLT